MIKSTIFGLSLLVNGLVAYTLISTRLPDGDHMTCEQAQSETENKLAVSRYAAMNGSSLAKTHEFLKNSGYDLRNIAMIDGRAKFIYKSHGYRMVCRLPVPSFDGSIVRINTDMMADPRVVSVF